MDNVFHFASEDPDKQLITAESWLSRYTHDPVLLSVPRALEICPCMNGNMTIQENGAKIIKSPIHTSHRLPRRLARIP